MTAVLHGPASVVFPVAFGSMVILPDFLPQRFQPRRDMPLRDVVFCAEGVRHGQPWGDRAGCEDDFLCKPYDLTVGGTCNVPSAVIKTLI